MNDAPPSACFIVPPHVHHHLARSGDTRLRDRALRSLSLSERVRGQREVLSENRAALPAGARRRTIYDADHTDDLPGRLVRGEGARATRDADVNDAYANLGVTFDFFAKVFGRSSLDGRGLRLDASVHFAERYDNAFWNGQQMVFGDGDGRIFRRFTPALEVVAHELTHGVVQFSAALVYRDEAGALNESMADVFGVLTKQWSLKQSARAASWRVGEGILVAQPKQALRSLAAPGTAYDDPVLGKDPQPAHMRDYVRSASDAGGVHLNSGIPNHAFYLAATRFGGRAWEKAGQIWYRALTRGLEPRATFPDAARETILAAHALLGAEAERVVERAWAEVGVTAMDAGDADVAAVA
jgi:Zn-dependent metalloprotease